MGLSGYRKLIQTAAESSAGILVTSYDQLRLQRADLLAVPWGYAILDEGHKIRNPDAEVGLTRPLGPPSPLAFRVVHGTGAAGMLGCKATGGIACLGPVPSAREGPAAAPTQQSVRCALSAAAPGVRRPCALRRRSRWWRSSWRRCTA